MLKNYGLETTILLLYLNKLIMQKVLLLTFAIVSCIIIIPPVYGQNSEETAILSVIQQETDDFTKLPFNEVAKKYWILDDKTFICATGQNGDVSFLTKDDMASNNQMAPEDKTIVEKTNYRIIVNGNMATVYHHQKVTLVEYNIILYSHEIRILEKVDGLWKIHCSSVQHYLPKE